MEQQLQTAWDRIKSLGGRGVWDAHIVAVSLAGTGVADSDLAVFREFPIIQTLDLSNTAVGHEGIAHLTGLPALTRLVLIGTQIGEPDLVAFRHANPAVQIVTDRPANPPINPFTGRPM